MADARRALWLTGERALVVADVHLGFAWAQRQRGQLLPLSVVDDTVERLAALQQAYQPRQLVLLGDILHRALPVPAICDELRRMVEVLSAGSELVLVLGNHDAQLGQLVERLALPVRLVREHRVGTTLLVHGDQSVEDAGWDRVVLGHEHPAVELGDGVASAVKCPCFLIGPRVAVLPAFSRWAAGCPIERGAFLSPLTRAAEFHQAIAIVGERLLPLPVRLGAAGRAE